MTKRVMSLGVTARTGRLSQLLLTVALGLSAAVFAQVDTKALEKSIAATEKKVASSEKVLKKANDKVAGIAKDILKQEQSIAALQKEIDAQADAAKKAKLQKDLDKLTAKKAVYEQNKAEAERLAKDAQANVDALKVRLAADQKALSNPEVLAAAAAPAVAPAPAAAPAVAAAPAQATTPTPAQVAANPSRDWQPRSVTLPWSDPEQKEATLLKGDKELKLSEPKKKEYGTAGAKYEFDIAMVAGDRKIVENLDVWNSWAESIPFRPVTAEEIQDFYVALVKGLKEAGYVFAKVDFPTRPWSNGIFVAKVDCAPLGNITVNNARHFSEKQLRRKLATKDGKFNYAETYNDLFDLNSNPDLKLQTQLKPVIQGGRQIINAEVNVQDKVPVHGAIELRNDGSKESSDWRLRTTLQHLNVTDHFDSLTIEWLTGGLFKHVGEDLNALSASYFLPIDDLWSFNLYGGWNESDMDDVLPEIGVKGKGWYMGAQLTRILRETQTYRQQISLTWMYQEWNNEQIVEGTGFDDREITVSMPGVTLGHVDKVFDKFDGRNYASLSLQQNIAGNWGSSTSKEFNESGSPYCDGDFLLARLQLARFQRFFEGEDVPGKWSLFMKTDAQFSTDDLPANLREFVGGFDSVRGYEEAELGGDKAVTATLELRTPLMENFLPGLKRDAKFLEDNPEYWGAHRVQFIVFTDYGYVSNHTEAEEEDNNQSFWSLGLGLRLGLTKYTQMSLDYGYPLVEASEDTPEAGRFHFSVQAQF